MVTLDRRFQPLSPLLPFCLNKNMLVCAGWNCKLFLEISIQFHDQVCPCVSCMQIVHSISCFMYDLIVKYWGFVFDCCKQLISCSFLGSNQGSNSLTLKGWPLTVRLFFFSFLSKLMVRLAAHAFAFSLCIQSCGFFVLHWLDLLSFTNQNSSRQRKYLN